VFVSSIDSVVHKNNRFLSLNLPIVSQFFKCYHLSLTFRLPLIWTQRIISNTRMKWRTNGSVFCLCLCPQIYLNIFLKNKCLSRYVRVISQWLPNDSKLNYCLILFLNSKIKICINKKIECTSHLCGNHPNICRHYYCWTLLFPWIEDINHFSLKFIRFSLKDTQISLPLNLLKILFANKYTKIIIRFELKTS
jgi:hypothetical protein